MDLLVKFLTPYIGINEVQIINLTKHFRLEYDKLHIESAEDYLSTQLKRRVSFHTMRQTTWIIIQTDEVDCQHILFKHKPIN